MKSEPVKTTKHGQKTAVKAKPVCGTLIYLAECRGTPKKTSSVRKEAPAALVGRFVRKQPPAFS
jgi:hypothetical protein